MKRRTRVALLCTLLVPFGCKKDEEKAPDATATADGKSDAKSETKDDATADAPAPAVAAAAGSGSAEAATDALARLPGDTAVAFHIDFKRMAASPIWAEAKKAAETDPENVKRMAAFAKCGISFDGLSALAGPATLTVGMVGDEQGAGVLHMASAGKKDFVDCLVNAIKAEEKDADIKMGEFEGQDVLEIEDDGIGFLVPDDHLVITPKEHAAAIKSVLFDGAANASTGSLPGLVAKVAPNQAMWFVADVTAMKDAPKGGPMAGLQSAVGGVDISAGLAVKADLTFADAAQASKTQAAISQQWNQVKPMSAAIGVPPETANKVSIKATDAVVTVSVSLTADELAKIGASINAMTQSAAAAGGPPPGMPPAGGQ